MYLQVTSSAPQLENIPLWSKNILREWCKLTFGGGGQKYTKHNKINSNSEIFRGAKLLPGGFAPGPS